MTGPHPDCGYQPIWLITTSVADFHFHASNPHPLLAAGYFQPSLLVSQCWHLPSKCLSLKVWALGLGAAGHSTGHLPNIIEVFQLEGTLLVSISPNCPPLHQCISDFGRHQNHQRPLLESTTLTNSQEPLLQVAIGHTLGMALVIRARQ